MDYRKTIKDLDSLILNLKGLRHEYIKTDKLSSKRSEMNYSNNSKGSIEKCSANLNWQCMYLHKQKKKVCEAILELDLEVDTTETEYKPSGFHVFKG